MDGNLLLLLALCAPAIDPVTGASLVRHESGGHPYLIGINGGAKLSRQPSTEAQAVATARALIQRGLSIDMGLAQINSNNLPRLGLTVDQIFRPCVNVQAMQTVLERNYLRAAARSGPGQTALKAALSEYNTGNTQGDLANGYVRHVYQSATKP
jgi:type IV secretion system protein VirB1